MPTHVHQNMGLFLNAAEMKHHVNRTYFHADLKSQTGRSSFRLSCERNLSINMKSTNPVDVNEYINHLSSFINPDNLDQGCIRKSL